MTGRASIEVSQQPDVIAFVSEQIVRGSAYGGCFEPNVLVLTVFQTSPRVDFVWRRGRLIVEIDSNRFHSGPDRFTGDRQRDYETGASGYVTLRLYGSRDFQRHSASC